MMRSMKRLDVGCGRDKMPGAIGMDINPRSGADVIHDMEVTPWPFENDAFDYIRAIDVLEHVDNFIPAMEEIYRIARPNAEVEIRMPFMSSCNIATDPTHRRGATSRTFDYFDPKKDLAKYAYSKARFELEEFHYVRGYNTGVGTVLELVDKALVPLIERFALTYELYFPYIYPMHDISFRLRVKK